MSFLYKSKRIFLGNSTDKNFIDGGIVVDTVTGKITEILKYSQNEQVEHRTSSYLQVYDFGDKILMPGLIDSHVHINDPGRTGWEGFTTATKAAAAGGFTTLVDMPLNSIPPTITLKNLITKIDATNEKIYVDVGFWGGVIPNNSENIVELVKNGVVGFKCFLCNSGVDEFPKATRQNVEQAMEKMENLDTFLAFHAELEEDDFTNNQDPDPLKFKTFVEKRPAKFEVSAIKLISELIEKYKNVKLHIVHLSSAESIPIIRNIRKNSPGQLTVETCHHYLGLNEDQVLDTHTEFKCVPPVRNEVNREELWKALKAGDIDMIVSDHSPSTAELKLLIPGMKDYGNFIKAWGGISSVQFGLSLFWTNCQKYGFEINDMHRLMCENPAKLCGFNDRKGKIEVGYDGDFCVWDPDAEMTILQNNIEFKNKMTPYLNMTFKGVVHATILRGKVIYESSKGFEGPFGKCLLRNQP